MTKKIKIITLQSHNYDKKLQIVTLVLIITKILNYDINNV